MQRGIITFSKEELREILSVFRFDNYVSTPMYQKFMSALESNLEQVTVEVSVEELEIILDDIGLPNENNSEILTSAITKIREKVFEFRS